MTINDALIIKYLRELKLPRDVEKKVYTRAYRRLMLKLHPDKNGSKSALFAGMPCKEITALHSVILSNYVRYNSPTKKSFTTVTITLSSDDEDTTTNQEPNAKSQQNANQPEPDAESSDEPEFDIYADPYAPWR